MAFQGSVAQGNRSWRFSQDEVAAGQKRFLLGPVKALPEDIRDLPALSDIGNFQPETWKPTKIENRNSMVQAFVAWKLRQ